MNVLILTLDRPNELKNTLKFLNENFQVTKIFFYIDGSYDDNCKINRKNVLKVIDSYKGDKSVLALDQNIGVSKAMKNALKWVSESVDNFMVLEDDIQVSKESFDFYELNKESLLLNPCVINLGHYYWGFLINKSAIDLILDFKFENLTVDDYEKYKSLNVFKNKRHFIITLELYRRNSEYTWGSDLGKSSCTFAWDEEFDIISKLLSINIIKPETPTTLHKFSNSSRINRDEIVMQDVQPEIVMLRNGKIIS